MDDNDFWGEFGIDYSGGTDQLFDFDIDPATLGGIDINELIKSLEGFDIGSSDEVYAGSNFGVDPYEVDGQQGSRDESTALTGTSSGLKDIIKTIKDVVGGDDNLALISGLLGGLAGMKYKKEPTTSPMWDAKIPSYRSVRGAPGQGISLVRRAAGGGIMDLAAGGRPARYLAGGTDGMADKIQTDIDGKQPARLSHGEFVIPADVVSHLGNGNSDAGAKVLYDMMAKVRRARTGNPKQGKQINPRKFTPA